MFDLKQFFKKLKLEKEEIEANPVSGFNAIEKFKQEIIPKVKSIGRGITAVAKSPFQIVEKKPERFTFETEQDFAERTKNIESFKDKGLPETQASQFIKSAGARLPEELIKGGAKAIQTLGQLGKIGLDKDISETTKVPKQLQRFIGNEKELKSYYVEYAECVDKGGNPFICSAKNASKFALDLSIVMDFALTGIKSGIKALPINKTIEEVGHKASFIQLGRPKTIEQAEINYKNILRNVSPLSSKANRLGTVNVEASKEAKNAFDLLKAKGIPNTSKLGEFLGRLEKPFKIKEFFKEAKKLRETGFIHPKAFIPEQAGTIPTELFKPKTPAFGLSIRDIKAKPIKQAGGVSKTDSLTTSIKSAKQSGQSFDEWVKGQGEVGKILKEGGVSQEKTKDILLKLHKVINKSSLDIEKDIRFIADTANPNTRKAFEEITGVKLGNTQKGAQQQIRDFIGKETPTKKWLTTGEAKKSVQDNIGKEVVIDDNKRNWIGGREPRTSNPSLVKLVGIEDNRVIYTRGGYEYSKHIDTVRDIIVGGKSQIGDIGNEKYASSLFPKTRSQLKAEWDRVGREIKQRQMKTSAEIPSLEKMAKEFIPKEKLPTTIIKSKAQEIQKVSYNKDIAEETKLVKQVQEKVAKKDFTKTIEDVREIKKEPDTITTRKFKQTDEWKSFAKYAEENLQDKDIRPAMLFRHTTMTAERVAEFLDGGLDGITYRTIVKPVYDSAKKMTIEGNQIKQEFDSFRILEGTKLDRDASLFGQKKLTDAPQKAKEATEYVRNKYDEFLTRLNEIRAKIGIEPIPKRQDYIA